MKEMQQLYEMNSKKKIEMEYYKIDDQKQHETDQKEIEMKYHKIDEKNTANKNKYNKMILVQIKTNG